MKAQRSLHPPSKYDEDEEDKLSPGHSMLSGASDFLIDGSKFSSVGGDLASLAVNVNILPNMNASSSKQQPPMNRASHVSPRYNADARSRSVPGHHLWNYLSPMNRFRDLLGSKSSNREGSFDGAEKKLDMREGSSDTQERKLAKEMRPGKRRKEPGKAKNTPPGLSTDHLKVENGISEDETSTSSDMKPKLEPIEDTADLLHAGIASAVLKNQTCTVSPLNPAISVPEIYSRLMLVLTLGYPLYIPEPDMRLSEECRKEGVRIGDVGRVTSAGAFDFLFNICLPADHPVNPSFLPEGFETVPPIDISIHHNFLAPGEVLPSEDVIEVDDHPERYHFTGREGAVLALPEGATLFEAQDKTIFKNYAARHAESWYKYMNSNKHRDAPNGSLYLVTGCIKSEKWGIGTFYRGPTPGNYLQLTPTKNPSSTSQGVQGYRWKKKGRIIARIGPASGESVALNQCGFLRGYKIMLQQDAWDRLSSTVSVPSHGGQSHTSHSEDKASKSSSGRSQGGTSTSASSQGDQFSEHKSTGNMETLDAGQVIVEDDFNAPTPIHPADFVNVMLLHFDPRARVAVTHDTIWCETLPKRFATTRLDVKILEMLKNITESYLTSVDQFGCISLVSKTQCKSEDYTTRTIGGRGDFPYLAQTSDPQRALHGLRKSDDNDSYEEYRGKIYLFNTTQGHNGSFDEEYEQATRVSKKALHCSRSPEGAAFYEGSYNDSEMFDSTQDQNELIGDEMATTTSVFPSHDTAETPCNSDPMQPTTTPVSKCHFVNWIPNVVGTERMAAPATKRRMKPALYTCPFTGCGDTFTSLHTLRYHQYSHLGIQLV